MVDIKWNHLREVLEGYADAWIKNAHANLNKNDSNASGQLQRSMNLDKIVIDDNKMRITIELEDYWYYLENGTSPNYGAKNPTRKMPPIQPIIDWIESKPVPPKVQGLTIEQRAFAIAKGIQKNGTKPHPFFEKTKKQTWNEFKDDIAEAVEMDVSDYLDSVVSEGVGNIFGA
jgi:hypothetical protein